MNTRTCDAPHDMLLPARGSELSRELFCRSLTNFLEVQARPPLRDVYDREIEPRLRQQLGRAPQRREIARAMRELPANRAWYALRTRAQRMSYDASARVVERQRDELQSRARAVANAAGSLALDAALPMPRYLTALDIHNMPGGYLRESGSDDLAAGALFDRQMTVNRMGSQGALNDDPGISLAAFVQRQYPDFRPRRILELGCTVGHNLLPFKLAWPEAEVHGIDVSAPCLRYAHARAAALGIAVHLHQQNAEQLAFPDASFDLVFSRILLHETSHAAVPRIFAESFRVLAPGGLALHSDAPQFDELDPYVASLRDWDIRCNNEPFMDGYYDMPVEELLSAAGFDRSRMQRAYAPSQYIAAQGVDPRLNRSGGRYFLISAWK